MNRKPKYFLTKIINKYPRPDEYQIIYPDYINIEKIYRLANSKYDIKLPSGLDIDTICKTTCNISIFNNNEDKFSDEMYDKLKSLNCYKYNLGGVIDNNSINPEDAVLSQTGNCVILAPIDIYNSVKIHDNAIVGIWGKCSGNIIIKDNAVVLTTLLDCIANTSTNGNNSDDIIRIQGNSVILNSSIEIDDDDLFTIDIRDYAYLKDVKISKNGNHYNKSSSVILSSYTYLEKMELCFSAYIEGLVRIYNIDIKSNDKLTFYIYKSCTLVGVTIDINKITEEELVSFFKKNKIKDRSIMHNNNIVGYCNRMYVLLDDFINEFSN